MTQFLRNLSMFSKEEMNTFLGSFDTILTDCDGVLWYLHEPLPGSIDVINKFKDLGKKVFLVTNNSTLTLDAYMDKIKAVGLNVKRDEIIIPAVVASHYFNNLDFKKKAFILASSAFKKEFESNGIKCSNDVGPDHELKDAYAFKLEMENMDPDVGAVVIDFDLNINYIKLMKALLHLKKPDCLFVVGASDMQIPVQENINIIGPGCFISALETLSGRKAVVTGKPSPLVKDFINMRHPLNPKRTLMIGDMLSLDIKFGTNCGFQKLLVLSGVSKLEDTKEDDTNLPHYYIKSLGDFMPFLESLHQ